MLARIVAESVGIAEGVDAWRQARQQEHGHGDAVG